ncbi:2'-5' RNA ligase family protein [Candidatus Pacearchaeota archaeon]|nr:2'-5' RNA ligase family protein [Candidatus Pacearchaeota archaeon]
MAKYCLVYVLEGKAKTYHIALTKEISKKFKVKNPSKRVAPHLTIKEIGNITNKKQLLEVISKIDEVSKKIKKFNVQLNGINCFGKDVIFLDVKKTKRLMKNYEKVYLDLIKVKFIPKISKFEGKNMHFHATLCAFDIKDKFDKIMQYLAKKNITYKISFNNFVLKKKVKNIWKPIKIWRLK